MLHRRLAADLSTAMIYALLRLRVEVFVVELGCPYQELDGHDLDRTTRHYWLAPDGAIEEPQATLRLLEPIEGQFRIDRICTPGRPAVKVRSDDCSRRRWARWVMPPASWTRSPTALSFSVLSASW